MKREPRQAGAKLVDRLVADPLDGRLLGFVSTTYEMSPEFVETDFIPTLLGIGAWDDRAWSSRIAMEKRLAELEGAAILTAAEPYRGRPRSLRLEIKPVLRRGAGSLHAKCFVAVYEDSVRLIIGSANLTEQGYRENREIAVVLTASEAKPSDAHLVASAVRELISLLADGVPETVQNIFQLATKRLDQWATSSSLNRWVLWSGGEQPLWQQFVERWPKGEAIERISIVSPFWSEESGRLRPVETLVNALKDRGKLLPSSSLRLLTAAAPDAQATYKPTLPESFNSFNARRLGLSASASAVDPISHDDKGAVRRLHAKIVLVEGPSTSLLYAGSANFTRRGWGFMEDPSAANIEAGLVIWQASSERSTLANLLPKITGAAVPLDGAAVGKFAPPVKSALDAPWPIFIDDVRLVAQPGRPTELALLIVAANSDSQWTVTHTGEGSIGSAIASGGPMGSDHNIALSKSQLEQILRDQEVLVIWPACPTGRAVPVNVDAAARLDLPVTPGSGALREGDLISYYQGRVSWEDLFPDPDANGSADPNIKEDPGQRGGVDTSKIQSYIVREFVEALKGMADDLSAAAQATKASMRLAILGAVSPVALARRIAESGMSGARTPTAAGFQLVEIQVVLRTAEDHKVSAALREDWSQFLYSAQDQVRGMLDQLKEKYRFELPAAFHRYESTVLRKAGTK